jgi:hypothetical protein
VLIAAFGCDVLATQFRSVAIEPGEVGDRAVGLRGCAQAKRIGEALRQLAWVVARKRQCRFRFAERQQQATRLRPLVEVPDQIDHTLRLTLRQQHAREIAGDFFLRRAQLHRSLERTGGGRGIAHRQVGASERNTQARIVRSVGECFEDQRLRARRIVRREARFSLLE